MEKLEMTDSVLRILMSAVTVARNEQIRTVQSLKQRLTHLYPGRDAEIDEAISEWAARVQHSA